MVTFGGTALIQVDPSICGGCLKSRTVAFKLQRQFKAFCFMLLVSNLLLAQRGREEKEQMHFEYLRFIMLRLSFEVRELCL